MIDDVFSDYDDFIIIIIYLETTKLVKFQIK